MSAGEGLRRTWSHLKRTGHHFYLHQSRWNWFAMFYVLFLKFNWLCVILWWRSAPLIMFLSSVHSGTQTFLTCMCLRRLSLLRFNTNLTRYKNMLFSQSQQLQAKLSFFKTSIQHDLEQYTKQSKAGICEWMLLSCYNTVNSLLKSYLDYMLLLCCCCYLKLRKKCWRNGMKMKRKLMNLQRWGSFKFSNSSQTSFKV